MSAWTQYAAYASANAIDEAYYEYIEDEYGHLESKYLDKLPSVIDELIAAEIKSNAELSRYIKDNRLGDQFPEISGIVTMSDGRDAWALDGGVSPQMYRVLCEELGLTIPKSGAHLKSFDSYSRSYC